VAGAFFIAPVQTKARDFSPISVTQGEYSASIMTTQPPFFIDLFRHSRLNDAFIQDFPKNDNNGGHLAT